MKKERSTGTSLKQFAQVTLLLANFSLASGCATMASISEQDSDNKVFGGTIKQAEMGCAHGNCIDAPFSLIADVVLLPITIPWSLYNLATSDAEESTVSEQSQTEDPIQ